MKSTIVKISVIIIITGATLFAFLYSLIFGNSIDTRNSTVELIITENSDFEQVFDSLNMKLDIKHPGILKWVAVKKNYPSGIKPGRYLFEGRISCNELVNTLRSGLQQPVSVTFNNIRTLEQLAGRIGGQIEADSLSIIEFLNDPSNYYDDGFTRETIIALFIPNTYQLYWNTSAKGLYDRMLKEYKIFWNDSRQQKASLKGLTPVEVSILASIVDDEVLKAVEKPTIAGVYLNRLKRGIPLQACPTIKFALNDFTITRVLTKHLSIESPYNTYKFKGFPPGPIGCPTIEGIDAVLNAEDHNYLFFAAKADFSGYHNFSRTLAEHNRYAAEYQRELNRRKIYR